MAYAMIIDDNTQTTEALVAMLKIWNISARTALNPGYALPIMNKEIPKVVFLDLNMPGVNGFDVLEYFKREPQLAKIPVVIVTSDDQPQTYKKAKEGGAEAVIIKPVMVDLLEKALKKIGLI